VSQAPRAPEGLREDTDPGGAFGLPASCGEEASSHLAAFILLSATLAEALPKVPYFASYAGQLPGCFNVMFGSVGLSLEVVVVGVVRGLGA